MLAINLPKRACWTSEAAHQVFRTEALEGNDAVFLATHTPIRGFSVTETNTSDILEPSEEGLLQALSASSKRHAFCVIQGEPGSGKSHLIRWLYINWPRGRDLPLLLQRSDGSLEGALRQLKQNLPPEFLHLFSRIGQRQRATPEGRAAVFHTSLTAMLRPGTFDPPPEDDGWCRQWSPASLLMSEKALENWKAPGRLVRLMSGEGERNSEIAQFNIFDVAELVEIVSGDSSTPASGRALLTKLVREADQILEEKGYGQSAEAVAKEIGTEIPFTNAFVEALNRRKNDAIQNVIGVSAEAFKDLFREVRSALAKQARRLVLLLEDITSWEGLDDSLIDVLVTNASTRDSSSAESDLCDLISVVGLTPQYMRTLKANYKQRITHEIRLGEGGDDQLQDVVTVRDPDNRLRFVSKYLAATRATKDELDRWREELKESAGSAPPNKCHGCAVREGCFASFGAVEDVGLFPFTENAVRGFYEALKDDDAGMTWKTPRGLIQAVLSPTLSHPDSLEEGHYPGPHIERSTFTEQSRHLSGALTSMIEAQVDSAEDAARLRRIFTFWGAGGRAELVERSDGHVAFHNVDQAVFEAFQAPWIGAEFNVQRPASVPVVPLRDDEQPAIPASSGTDPAPDPEGLPDPQPLAPSTLMPDGQPAVPLQVSPAPQSGGPSVQPTSPTVSRLRLNPDDIRTWRDNPAEKLRSPVMWNTALYKIVQSVNPRKIGADLWLWEKFLTPDLVKLQGTSKESSQHFIVPPSSWALAGLEAFAVLTRADRSTTPAEREFYKRQLARMMRHLERALSAFFDRRLSCNEEGQRWNPAVAAAQILLVRAWLRRATLPTATSDQQWTALLSDEIGAESDPRARTRPWQAFLEATNKSHGEVRNMLRRMVAVPQSGATGQWLAAGTAAGDVMALIHGSSPVAPPSELPPQGVAVRVLESVSSLLEKLDSLGDIPGGELKLIFDRAGRLNELLRGNQVGAHLQRIDQAIVQADEELGGAAPDRVRTWKANYERVQPLVADNQGVLEDLIIDFVDEAQNLPSDRTALLGRLIEARAGLLQSVLDCCVVGEAAIDALVVHVESAVRQNPVDGDGLDGIQQKGALLLSTSERIRSLLQSEGE